MKNQLIQDLYRIGCIKFGEFTLKNGMISPIYIDLRLIVSFPDILKKVANSFWEKIHHLKFDLICGVPYTALPIASTISVFHDIPMVMRRKEAKEYGTKKIIEGVFSSGARCLIVEDLITTGQSVFETIEPLHAVGLEITDAVVLLDREQGGKKRLQDNGIQLHAVLKMSDLLSALYEEKLIDAPTLKKVKEFLAQHQV